ncbi:MAG: HAD family hydrolase, partial [Prevotella sp.]
IAERQKDFRIDDWHKAVLDNLYAATSDETARSKRVLERLKERKPMVLVSNFYGNITTVLEEFGLDGIFGNIIESAVVGIRKPDHRIFTLGVKALRLAPGEVVVVGDSYDKDILPAHKAGCRTVWMKGEPWTDTPEADTTAADMVISSLDELL